MKIAVIFILFCGVVVTVHGQNAWGWKPSSTKRPAAPTAAPVAAAGIDGNGQLIGCPCRSTQETNLVCGTDGNTYGNIGKLRCAQKCKVVEVAHLGSCSARDPLAPIIGQ